MRMKRLAVFGAAALVGAAIAGHSGSVLASHVDSSTAISGHHGSQLVIPMMDPERGKTLFVSKACVTCHAVNGVGGHDSPAMDAHRDMGVVNPFDFAAKMWNHAPTMVAAQQGVLGDQIYLTGQELADIIAFLHDDEAQHGFSEKDLTPQARKLMHHDHGGKAAPAAHAKELGHAHAEEPHGH